MCITILLLFEFVFQLKADFYTRSVTFKSDHIVWHQPSTLQELLEIKAQYKDAKIVTGCTWMGMLLHILPFHCCANRLGGITVE